MNLPISGSSVPFSAIQGNCLALSQESFNACVSLMTDAPSTTTQAIMNLFGGIEGFCKLPELPFEDCKLGRTEYLDQFRFKDLCAPVMRGVDCFKRLYVIFGFEKYVADPSTHKEIDSMGSSIATLFQRYDYKESFWVLLGSPTESFSRPNVIRVDENREGLGSLAALEKLLRKESVIQGEGTHNVGDKNFNIELRLAHNFNQIKPMCSKSDEL